MLHIDSDISRNYSSLTGLQAFAPATSVNCGDGCVPLEVLIDFRCENSDFDRLAPQTDATFHYDKFNRLRLRNNVTSVGRTASEQSTLVNNNHLQNQTVSIFTIFNYISDTLLSGSYSDSHSAVHCLGKRSAIPSYLQRRNEPCSVLRCCAQDTL
jgi:hypothetical protein